jgi:hypothetical protein
MFSPFELKSRRRSSAEYYGATDGLKLDGCFETTPNHPPAVDEGAPLGFVL